MSSSRQLPRRRLGRSAIEISAIGFGSAPLGDFFEHLDEAVCHATVRAALAAGITLFDTAPHYGNGLAEARLGAALRGVARDSFVLSSKVGRVMLPHLRPGMISGGDPEARARGFAGGLPHRAVFDYSRDGAMRSFEQSLLRLGTDRLDILLIHDVDSWTHGSEGQAEQKFAEAMNGAVRALHELRDQGVVRSIGAGLDDELMAERFANETDFDVMLLAGRYSLLEQPALQRFLPLALRKSISVILGGVFNSGILATGAVPGARYNYEAAPPEILDRVARIESVCARHGVALSDAALHFALAHPAVASVVLGSVKPSEIALQMASLAVAVPPGLWTDLKADGLLDPAAPVPPTSGMSLGAPLGFPGGFAMRA